MRLETNDPDQPIMVIAVTGTVEKFAEIRPERVRLSGQVDQRLFAEVEIVPRKDYPFTIERVDARSGNFIKHEWVKRCADGHDRCVLRVENTRKKKGRYIDVLSLSTTSKLRPTIPIYVTGMIQ